MFLAGETNGLWLPPGKSWKILPARPVTGNCSALKLASRGESFSSPHPLWTTAAYVSRTKTGEGKWQTRRQRRDSWNSHTAFPTKSFLCSSQRLCGRHRPWEGLPCFLTQVPQGRKRAGNWDPITKEGPSQAHTGTTQKVNCDLQLHPWDAGYGHLLCFLSSVSNSKNLWTVTQVSKGSILI